MISVLHTPSYRLMSSKDRAADKRSVNIWITERTRELMKKEAAANGITVRELILRWAREKLKKKDLR